VDDVAVYPNPTLEYLNIAPEVSNDLKILNMQGSLVATSQGQTQLDVSTLPAGRYIISYTKNGKRRTQSWVKL